MPAPFSYAPRLAGVPVLWNIMKIDIVSVFPEYFEVLNLSLLGKAQEKGLVEVTAHNLRDWTHDVHHSVDDTPVGGGAGMVMKPEVWSECLDELLHLEPTTVTCDSTADADDTASADAAEPAESATEIAANADTVPATDRPVLIFPNPSAPPVHPAGRDGAEPRQPSAVRLRPLRRLRRAYSAVLPCAGRRRA